MYVDDGNGEQNIIILMIMLMMVIMNRSLLIVMMIIILMMVIISRCFLNAIMIIKLMVVKIMIIKIIIKDYFDYIDDVDKMQTYNDCIDDDHVTDGDDEQKGFVLTKTNIHNCF
jgi:hypothetical protein